MILNEFAINQNDPLTYLWNYSCYYLQLKHISAKFENQIKVKNKDYFAYKIKSTLFLTIEMLLICKNSNKELPKK